MIEEAESETWYYHFDALGSVVALSDSSGDTVQTYQYTVFGEVWASDTDHPNPYMFAGRRFDIEIGLYYNGARYYNPFIGRFLQVDPVEYEDNMNLYAYCGNNPLNFVDPSGKCMMYPGYTAEMFGIDMNEVNDVNISDAICNFIPDPCWAAIANILDSNWVDCMGRCIEDNDPINYVLEIVVVNYVINREIKKTTALKLARMLGDKAWEQELIRGIRWGKNPKTSIPGVYASRLKAQGLSTVAKRGQLHRLGDILTGGAKVAVGVYAAAMAAIETHCFAYCTACQVNGLSYSKEDADIWDTIRDEYFSGLW